jgi:hypothetical protein
VPVPTNWVKNKLLTPKAQKRGPSVEMQLREGIWADSYGSGEWEIKGKDGIKCKGDDHGEN